MRDNVGNEVAEVRNKIVEMVLHQHKGHPISHLFWLDDDVFPMRGCLRQLLARDMDIVSGVYFQKDETGEPLIFPSKCGGTDHFIPNRFYPVWAHGMGLTLVRREVYERMQDELDLGKDKYGHTKWYHTSGPDDPPVIDAQGSYDGGHTEDLYFLDHAAKLGYQPWIDTHQHAFGFHYSADQDVGYPLPQWKQWIAGESITWETPAGPVVWE